MAEFAPGDTFTPTDEPAVPAGGVGSPPEASPAAQRFQSCRWRKVAEGGIPDHCAHRDVQPIAGAAGFSPEAWCPECGFFKVRRNPRKRPEPLPNDRFYY